MAKLFIELLKKASIWWKIENKGQKDKIWETGEKMIWEKWKKKWHQTCNTKRAKNIKGYTQSPLPHAIEPDYKRVCGPTNHTAF